jgi:hypothetical protein
MLLEGLSDAVGFVGGAWRATGWAGCSGWTCLRRATAPPASSASCSWAWAAAWACRLASALARSAAGGFIAGQAVAMAFVEPVTLSERGVTLVPLALVHEDGLRAAAADGELWNIRVTSVPEPDQTRTYIEDALAMRAAGNRFAFAVLDSTTGACWAAPATTTSCPP